MLRGQTAHFAANTEPVKVGEILRELQVLTGNRPYVFPGARDRHRPMSDAAINAALRWLGYDTRTENIRTYALRPRAGHYRTRPKSGDARLAAASSLAAATSAGPSAVMRFSVNLTAGPAMLMTPIAG